MITQLPNGNYYVSYKYDVGGKTIKPSSYYDQIFTFIVEDTGEEYHFDVTKLNQFVSNHPELVELCTFHLSQHQIDHIIKNNGVEKERLDTITKKYLKVPGVIAFMPDESHIIIDGNHRAVARYRNGSKTMQFFVVPFEHCRPVLLDVPQGSAMHLSF